MDNMAGPLPHLDTFALAAELGSFTGAARRLEPPLTQAAVSQRIAALEQELGVRLFDRVHGRVELTAAGRRLHELAQQIQALHEQARREIAQQSEGVRGELVLAASTVPGEYMLPSFLADFRAKHPKIQVRATVVDSAAVFDLIERGDAQLGMAGRPCDSAHLEQRAFGRDEILLVLPPKHPLAKSAVTLDQLRAEPLLLREPGSGSRLCVEQALDQAGLTLAALNVAAEVSSNEAIKEMVQRGAGVAFLSKFAVAADVDAQKLAAVPVSGLNLTREFYAVYDRRRALSLPARLFLELLLG
jgi:DNA-binding transcriptional LysR family regulator